MNTETLIKIIEDLNNPETTETVENTIEQWRAVATIAEEIDTELASHAWFSVGSLLSESDRKEGALPAYDKAIHINPNNANAYNDRGSTKFLLGQLEEAISDYMLLYTLTQSIQMLITIAVLQEMN